VFDVTDIEEFQFDGVRVSLRSLYTTHHPKQFKRAFITAERQKINDIEYSVLYTKELDLLEAPEVIIKKPYQGHYTKLVLHFETKEVIK
jgi:hypothetical protein